jgi:hypothetical protein
MLLPKTKLARFGLPPENSATSSPMARASVAVLLIFYTMSAEVIHSRLVAILKTA